MRRHARWRVLLAVGLFGLAVTVAPILAQEEDTQEPQIEDDFLESDPRPEIDAFLEDDMEVLAGEGETYDAGDRRDPFVSLLVTTTPPRTRLR